MGSWWEELDWDAECDWECATLTATVVKDAL